jgi:hypothetical protein
MLETKVDINNNKIENTWTSCCFNLDKRAVGFFTQVIFSASIVTFCIIILITNQDCATFSRYSPLLTLVVGVWLPSPRINN